MRGHLMRTELSESMSLDTIFLRTLYANKKAIWWTSIVQITATLMIYIKTQNPIYIVFAMAFFVTVLGRMANANAFEQADLTEATAAILKKGMALFIRCAGHLYPSGISMFCQHLYLG